MDCHGQQFTLTLQISITTFLFASIFISIFLSLSDCFNKALSFSFCELSLKFCVLLRSSVLVIFSKKVSHKYQMGAPLY